jgi:ubiquinone/menaquinone biosynthesis C-methylase UbiE
MESTADVYNKIAKEFKNTRHYQWPWIDTFISSIQKAVPNDNHIKILDIGCGSGRNIEAYQSENIIIDGIDNSSEFVNICKKNGLNVNLNDMTNISKADDMYDYILSIASFHHLNDEGKRIKCLREMKRVLKKNGQILLSVWSKNQPKKTKRVFDHYGDNMVPWKCHNGEIFDRYYYIFKLDELNKLFADYDFEIISYFWDCGNDVFIIKNKK